MGNPQYNRNPPSAPVTESTVLIPTTSPPYETPLDLRYPLHWASSGYINLARDSSTPKVERQAIRLAETLANKDLHPYGKPEPDSTGDYLIGPQVNLVQATYTRHLSTSHTLSPPYFEIGVVDREVSEELHGAVKDAVERHFGWMGYRLIVRYVVIEFDEDLAAECLW